jgi:DNA topoisomerase I
MTTLVVIEAPGKTKKMQAILGPGYLVKPSFGHVRDLPNNTMGVAAPDFVPEYVTEDDRARKAVADLRAAARTCDTVLLATDADREGEAIAWHVASILNVRNPMRITYQEITEEAVLAALNQPRALDMHLVHAQEARRVLDRLVGYGVSKALSQRAGELLTAGRVQSPATRILVDRERAIQGFTAITYYGVRFTFSGDSDWHALWTPELPNGERYVLSKEWADAISRVKRFQVVRCEDSVALVAPPAPFTTSTLQQRSHVALKFKPKRTMELAQALYEAGLITYMRTDSPNISAAAFEQIQNFLLAQDVPCLEEQRRWKSKKGAQEAHEAIRPTDVTVDDAGDDDDERALYRMIRMRTLASQMPTAEYAARVATLQSGLNVVGPGGPQFVTLVARGRTLINPGWLALEGIAETVQPNEEDEPDPQDNPVPELAIGVDLVARSIEVLQKKTRPPRRFTEATLVGELESLGLGRPATYASILNTITTRDYAKPDRKGFLIPTKKAEQIVDTLVGCFAFAELDYTRSLEEHLDDIAAGHSQYRQVVAEAHRTLTGELQHLQERPVATYPCPMCAKPLRRRSGKTGFWWGCTAYPDCRGTMADLDGKPVERAALAAANAAAEAVKANKPKGGPKCLKCGSPLQRRTKSAAEDPRSKGFDFYGCTAWPTCKETYPTDPQGKPTFPAGVSK